MADIDQTRGVRHIIAETLLEEGYTIAEQQSDTADPFSWSITAHKGDYEIVVKEHLRDRGGK